MDFANLLSIVDLSLKGLIYVAIELQKKEFIKGEDLNEFVEALKSSQSFVSDIVKTLETATVMEQLKREKETKKYDA